MTSHTDLPPRSTRSIKEDSGMYWLLLRLYRECGLNVPEEMDYERQLHIGCVQDNKDLWNLRRLDMVDEGVLEFVLAPCWCGQVAILLGTS